MTQSALMPQIQPSQRILRSQRWSSL